MKRIEKSHLYYLSKYQETLESMNPANGVMKECGLKYDEKQFLPAYVTLSEDGIDALRSLSLLSEEPRKNGCLH